MKRRDLVNKLQQTGILRHQEENARRMIPGYTNGAPRSKSRDTQR